MTLIVEAFFSSCISKIINDGTDYSKSKIINVINDKKHQSLSTKIYRIIERTLNIVTDKEYKDTEILYKAMERIFVKFKDSGSTVQSVKYGLELFESDVSMERCENFLRKFYDEVCKDEHLYKRIVLMQQEQGIKIDQEGFEQLNEKVDNVIEIVSCRNDDRINLQSREPVKSRTQEYKDKWNDNMFLNDFDKRDENAGVNVKLSEVYLEEHLPHYIWGDNRNPRTDLNDLLKDYIYNHNDNKMLLIFGEPAIGKSTLITWITTNFNDRTNEILVYKFLDLVNIDWKDGRISNRILEELCLKYGDLKGKILILDGFDEVSIDDNMRREILDSLYGDWIYGNRIEKFTLIVTCRENYIKQFAILKCKYITLQPWNEVQIRSFCNIFQEKTKKKISESTIDKLLEKREIFGIPLILYMVLALNISIEKEGSIVDVYDKIFALDGGIYDRCIDFKSFSEKHRVSEIKKQIHQISREIAVWMFENEPEKANIPQDKYCCICKSIEKTGKQKNKDVERDFLIGSFVQLKHCEGMETEKIYFVHRSIYEYFVAEFIYASIYTVEKVDELAGILGRLLKGNILSKKILDNLKYKIRKKDQINKYDFVSKSFELMLQNGMTFFTNKRFKNVIDCEMKVFVNMLEVVHMWEKEHYSFDNSIYNYLKYNRMEHLNLSKVNFKQMNLSTMYLRGADLSEANLRGVNLRGTDLRGAVLKGADIRGALVEAIFLSDGELENPDLYDADITDAIFDERQVNFLYCKYNLQAIKIFINETENLIRYQEYCNRSGWRN